MVALTLEGSSYASLNLAEAGFENPIFVPACPWTFLKAGGTYALDFSVVEEEDVMGRMWWWWWKMIRVEVVVRV